MKQRSEIEEAKAAALKTVRSVIRLKYSLEADHELNSVLPDVERRFDKAVNQGELPDPQAVVDWLEA